MNMSRPEVAFVMTALREAAAVARAVQQEMIGEDRLTKDDRSPVTVADFAVQALVGKRLAGPDALPLVAEEDSADLRQPANAETLARVRAFVARVHPSATPEAVCSWIDVGNGAPAGRFWTLDPVDGTKGFLRGEQYAIALALVDRGEVVLGGLACPNLAECREARVHGPGSLLIAARGEGAWFTPLDAPVDTPLTRLAVSPQAAPKPSRVLRSVEKGHTNVSRLDLILDAMGVAGDPVRLDSQAKYAVLAAGHAELLFRLLNPKQPEYEERVWDQAAGSIVVEEAGGRITDLSGKPLDFGQGKTLAANRGVLASNGPLHADALRALAELA